MPDMHAATARPPPRIQVKRRALLVRIQDEVQIAMAKHHAAPHEPVRLLARDPFEAFEQRGVDAPRAKGLDQLVVVDGDGLAAGVGAAGDVKGRDDLLLHGRRREEGGRRSGCGSFFCGFAAAGGGLVVVFESSGGGGSSGFRRRLLCLLGGFGGEGGGLQGGGLAGLVGDLGDVGHGWVVGKEI